MGLNYSIPLQASNSFIVKDVIYFCIESCLYTSDISFSNPKLLFTFKGGTRGLRSIFVSSKGHIFVSPEGSNLDDSMKGLWRSIDMGISWMRVINLANTPNPISIWGIAENKKGKIFAGTYALADNYHKAEIYRSDESGTRWNSVYLDSKARHVHQISIDDRTGAIYASFGDNFKKWKLKYLLKSCDEGQTWQFILPELPQIVPILIVGNARIFASDAPGGAKIFRTIDDQNCELVLWDHDDLYFYWIRKDNKTNYLYASAVPSSIFCKFSKIYISKDSGRSWQLLKKFECCELFDGSLNASNISNSKLIIHVQKNKVIDSVILLDLKSDQPINFDCRTPLRKGIEKTLAIIILLINIPIILLCILLIKLTTAGPVFFFQTRYGIYGNSFRIIKFRTRHWNSKNKNSYEQSVTKIGKVLKYLSLDEIPQCWNVVKGEMSLIGPRPHPLDLDYQYINRIPGIFKRYNVLPGMTGLAQTHGARGKINNLIDMEKRLKYDYVYIKQKKLSLDLFILYKTIIGGFIDKQG
jgi:putative colanic acid biosynthesis UDP-glucose lipid carrier transferase